MFNVGDRVTPTSKWTRERGGEGVQGTILSWEPVGNGSLVYTIDWEDNYTFSPLNEAWLELVSCPRWERLLYGEV